MVESPSRSIYGVLMIIICGRTAVDGGNRHNGVTIHTLPPASAVLQQQ